MLSQRERSSLTRALDEAFVRVKRSVSEPAVATWQALPDHRDANVERFVVSMAPRVQAATVQVARLTDAYVTRVLDDGRQGQIIDTATLRPGVTVADEYMRPANALWTSLSNGVGYSAAVSESATRLASLIATDLQLARTRQFAASTDGRKAASGGFRRVVTGRENCALCLIASTQRYHRGDLMPIHPGCDCGVEPLNPGENVGQVIDPGRLEATHNWVEATQGASDRSGRVIPGGSDAPKDYMDLIAVQEHGEYGPTLTWRRHSFTAESDI